MAIQMEYSSQSRQMIKILEDYFSSLNLHIKEHDVVGAPQQREYFLLSSNGDAVGEIKVSATTHMSHPYTTRHSEQLEEASDRKEDDAISVLWLSVSPDGYQGAGLGIALLFYGICKTYLRAPGAKYIILDDDSDKPFSVKKNIYHKLGLVNVGLISFKDISAKGKDALQISLGKGADNAKEGSITTFFKVAYPTYLGKYHTKKTGGKYFHNKKKTYRRKKTGKKRKNRKSTKKIFTPLDI